MSTPTGRAPRRASQAETYAVPQPSSTTSLPSNAGRTCTSASGPCQMPHVISSAAQAPRARAPVCSALDFVQSSRLRAASLLDELIVGEPQGYLALGRLGRVGAVDEVVRHRGGEVAPDRAGLRVCRIRRADR